MSSMRDSMPTVAAWIDDLRAAFGADQVNGSIMAGLAGLPTFYAEEAGHQLGTPATMPAEARLHVFSDEEIDEMTNRIGERADRARRAER